jgi:hypothetical protein
MRNKIFSPMILILLGGCSLILQGTSQEVTFTSEPEGAVFTVGGQTAVTPAKLDLPKGPYEITFEKQGYEKKTLRLDTRTSLWFYVDFGVSVVAVAVDVLTGAWRTFEVTELNAVLLALPDTPEDRQALLTSMPSDAEVLVDGAVRGRTPLSATLGWIPVEKEKSVTFRHAEFQDLTLVLIRDREVLHADLEPIPVRVRVAFRSAPPGAEAFLEGKSVGRTPVSLEVEWLPATPPKRVEMELEGYERTTGQLKPRDPGISLELKEQVEEIALGLKANPPGSLVQVDGGAQRAAGNEITLSWSPSGREHVLVFTHPGYRSKSVKVVREANKTPLEVRLIPLIGEDR